VLITFRPSLTHPGMLNHYRSLYTADEAVRLARDWQARLRRMGVPTVQLCVFVNGDAKRLTRLDYAEALREYVLPEASGEQ
jgi:hypothetical protein